MFHTLQTLADALVLFNIMVLVWFVAQQNLINVKCLLLFL
jgi:hypothetical protein